jgi:hypothetical protein
MKKGTRTVQRLCPCGCGQQIRPHIDKKTGRVGYYPKFIPGHGSKDWGRRLAERLARDGNPQAKPLGSRYVRYDGYVKVKTTKGWEYEHRLVAQTPEGLETHHKNGDTGDNRPENLQPMTRGEHARAHLLLDTWSRNFPACLHCGTIERSHVGRGLCYRCWQRQRAAEIGWPHR